MAVLPFCPTRGEGRSRGGGASLTQLLHPSPLVGEGARRADEGAVRISTHLNEATYFLLLTINRPLQLTLARFANNPLHTTHASRVGSSNIKSRRPRNA
jgi:hypothetical protein